MIYLDKCPHCGKRVAEIVSDLELGSCDSYEGDPHYCPESFTVVCNVHEGGCGATGGYAETKEGAARKWNKRDYPTCHYTPDVMAESYDEHGNEIESTEPADGCGCFVCDQCGYLMMFGDDGWFDKEPPYTPRFKFCPRCGAMVI